MAALPGKVVREDRSLDKTREGAAAELMKLRWHWTLDESNAGRVSIAQYAREVGRDGKTVEADAKGWEIIASAHRDPRGAPSPSDAREKARMGVESHAVAEAVAKGRGVSTHTARTRHKPTVQRVREVARERAEANQTSVEEEAPRVMADIQRQEKASERIALDRERARARHSTAWVQADDQCQRARNALTKALRVARDAELSDEEVELLQEDLNKVRALLGLLESAVSGRTNVDWDAELAKIGG